jgi:mono/diheme cytochrome c family protein
MRKLPLIVVGAIAIFLIPSSATAQDAAALYKKSCVTCHGAAGKGDGPMGPAMKTPDLSDAALMEKKTDEELGLAISKGTKTMPKFASLTAEQVKALVAYIRTFSAKK